MTRVFDAPASLVRLATLPSNPEMDRGVAESYDKLAELLASTA